MTDPIPISALEHHAYCERQCALIHIDGFWTDNAHTVRGTHAHRRVDHGPDTTASGVRTVRGMRLWSERHNLTGRADAVEFHEDGQVVPIEYKAGRRHGQAADIQLCAQAMCLEEMLDTEIAVGYLWLVPTRRRIRILLDPQLRSTTLDRLVAITQSLESGLLPVAPDDARCTECQLQGYCLPSVVARPTDLHRYEEDELLRCGA